jgi:hypothetical protein
VVPRYSQQQQMVYMPLACGTGMPITTYQVDANNSNLQVTRRTTVIRPDRTWLVL